MDAPPDFCFETDVIDSKSLVESNLSLFIYIIRKARTTLRIPSLLSDHEDLSKLSKREQLIVLKSSTMYPDGEKERHLPGCRAGPGGILPRRSAQLKTGKRPSVPSPARLEEFVHQFRESHYVSQCSGLLVGLSLSSYFIRELLVCWLFFSLLFVCVALLLLSGVLAVQAGEYLTVWARTLGRMTPVVALAHAALPVKSISDARKLE